MKTHILPTLAFVFAIAFATQIMNAQSIPPSDPTKADPQPTQPAPPDPAPPATPQQPLPPATEPSPPVDVAKPAPDYNESACLERLLAPQTRLELLNKKVELTDGQKTQILAIYEDDAALLAALPEDQRVEKMKELKKPSDAKVTALLTPEQRAKCDEMKEKGDQKTDKESCDAPKAPMPPPEEKAPEKKTPETTPAKDPGTGM